MPGSGTDTPCPPLLPSPEPRQSATFSEDTGQASEVRKLEQGPSPDGSFSLQGSLEANFIKDQVAGPRQYK